MAGRPATLIDQAASGLTVVSDDAGNGDTGLGTLLDAGRVDEVLHTPVATAD